MIIENPSSYVLIVDDDPDWVKIIKSLLEKVGIHCQDSDNYIDAIRRIQIEKPWVLILDLKLDSGKNIDDDKWDGWLLAKSAKENQIASIIVSGNPSDDRYRRAYKDFTVLNFYDKGNFVNRKNDFVQCVLDAIEQAHRTYKDAIMQGRINDANQANPHLVNQLDKKARKRIFISYCHKDRLWLQRFNTNLKVLVGNNVLAVWDDTKIKIGSKWREEIQNALSSASVALLLVTPEFLASDFIVNNELPSFLCAAKEKGLKIFWVAVKDSLYEETKLSDFQCANDPNRPLASLKAAERERVIVQICKDIKKLV